jgi:hypothetical protein
MRHKERETTQETEPSIRFPRSTTGMKMNTHTHTYTTKPENKGMQRSIYANTYQARWSDSRHEWVPRHDVHPLDESHRASHPCGRREAVPAEEAAEEPNSESSPSEERSGDIHHSPNDALARQRLELNWDLFIKNRRKIAWEKHPQLGNTSHPTTEAQSVTQLVRIPYAECDALYICPCPGATEEQQEKWTSRKKKKK